MAHRCPTLIRCSLVFLRKKHFLPNPLSQLPKMSTMFGLSLTLWLLSAFLLLLKIHTVQSWEAQGVIYFLTNVPLPLHRDFNREGEHLVPGDHRDFPLNWSLFLPFLKTVASFTSGLASCDLQLTASSSLGFLLFQYKRKPGKRSLKRRGL